MNKRKVAIGAGVAAVAAVGGIMAFRHWTGRATASAVASQPQSSINAQASAARPTPPLPAPGNVTISPTPDSARKAPAPAATATPPKASTAPKASAPKSVSPVRPAKGQPGSKLTRAEKSTLVVCHQLGTLRSTIDYWKKSHDGKEPDFANNPRWEQFLSTDGKQRGDLTRAPSNPFNGFDRVAVMAGGAKPGLAVKGQEIGWVYDATAGKLWAVDAAGKVFDDAAVDLVALDARGVKEVSPAVARRDLLVVLQSMRSQIALYMLQHEDRPPDFARYPAWEQLLQPTSRDGTPLASKKPTGPNESVYGPYISSTPVNALNARHKVAVVAEDVTPGLAVPGDYGYVFSTKAQRFYALDADGKAMPDPLPGSEWTTGTGRGESGSKFGANLQTVRAQMMLYKLQHNDDEADLTRYPNWEQLTGRTNVDGKPDPAGKLGPYLAKPPVNWRNGSAAVEVVKSVPAGYRTTKKVGYVQDATTGKIWMVDARGAVIFD